MASDSGLDNPDGVPLRQLRVLALIEVFRFLWKKVGTDVRRTVLMGGAAGGASWEEAETSDSLPLLPMSVVIKEVIPRTLLSWKGVVDGFSSGSIAPGAARSYFGQGHGGHMEKEVRLMLLIGADPAASLPSKVEEAVRASEDMLVKELRMAQRTGSGQRDRLVRRILDSLEAHNSIGWFIENIGGLLRAQVVLACPSPRGRGVAGNSEEHNAGYALDLRNLFNESSGDEPDGLEAGAATTGSASGIFAKSLESDPSRYRLQQILADLERRWQDLSANAALEAWVRVGDWGVPDDGRRLGSRNDRILGGLIKRSRAHVELLISLSTCPALVQWLLEVRRVRMAPAFLLAD